MTNLEIYIDGKRATKLMLKIRAKEVLAEYGNKIDYFFVKHQWPSNEDLQSSENIHQ